MAKRRSNSEGSIYQRRSDRLWVGAITTPSGRRVVYGKTAEAARLKLRKIQRATEDGLPVESDRTTVGDWLDTWLSTIVAGRNQPRTQQFYRWAVETHLKPALARIRIRQLRATDVDRVLSGIVDSGKSASTAKRVYATLHKALVDARRRGLVYQNICEQVDCPSPGQYEVHLPEPEAIARILRAADETEHGVLFRFLAMTGCRRAEGVGLPWSNVDLERGVVSITQTIQRLPGRGLVTLPTKSTAGRRGIALDAGTVAMLREHQGTQILRKDELPKGLWQEHGLVFPGPTGTPTDPDAITHAWKRIARGAGYPDMRLHDLRHGHCAGLIRAGVHPRVVQERLGHGSAAFTMQVYGHVGPGLQADAAAAFAADMAKL